MIRDTSVSGTTQHTMSALKQADAWLRIKLGLAIEHSGDTDPTATSPAESNDIDHSPGALSWLGGAIARRRTQLVRTCADGSLPTFNDEDVGVEFHDNPTFGIVVASFFLFLLIASVLVFCGIAYRACTAKDKSAGQRQPVGMNDVQTIRTVPTVHVHG